ncbi:MAG: DinB family protein [Anaerolineae bacterium]|nr:DinB family protein [Anaerolineae bacterium]
MANDKELVLARMAAVRARLLRELIGIDESVLITSRIYGDWTAANLLAHLGEYDNFYAGMVRDALADRLTEVGVDYSGIRDHLLRERVGDWSLEQSVEYLMEARANFVQTFAEAPLDGLKKKYRFSWRFGNKTGRSQAMLGTWAQWRHTHDAGHMDDLREWRKTIRETYGTGSKYILHAALRAARDDFNTSAALVPPKERETRPICGTWTLRDVLGHLADWDAYFLNAFNAMIGEPHTDLAWESDADAQNEKMVQKRRKQPYEQVWQEAQSTRAALLTELELLSDEMLGDPYGGDYSPYPTAYHCLWSALEHDLDHAAVLRRELGVAFPKYLLRFEGPFT